MFFFFFKQKTAYEMRISDWSSDVCSSDLSDAKAKVALGRMYAAGAGVPINKIEAARLYNKAADGGLPQAGARPTEKYLRYIERDGVTSEGARGQVDGSSIAASIRQTSVPLNNPVVGTATSFVRSEEHTTELQ